MNRAFVLIVLVVITVSASQVRAEDLVLSCTNPHGPFKIKINKKRVLIDGKVPAGLDAKSISIDSDYIAFRADLPELTQQWKIDRNSGAYTISGRLPSSDQELAQAGGSCAIKKRRRLF